MLPRHVPHITPPKRAAPDENKENAGGPSVQQDVKPIIRQPLGHVSSPNKKQRLELGVDVKPTLASQQPSQVIAAVPDTVLSQITAELDPASLLAMSLTSHSLRTFMLADESRTLWRSALDREGVPALRATDISLVQIAHLLFGPKECYECRKSRIERIDMSLRLRTCPACFRKNLKNRHTGYNVSVIGIDLPENFAAFAPFAAPAKSFWLSHRKGQTHHWMSQVLAVYRIMLRQSDLAAWSPGRRIVLENRAKDAEALTDWYDNRKRAVAVERSTIRANRKQEIETRLLARGWLAADFFSSSWTSHSLVKDTRPLTEEEWTTILPRLEARLQLQREQNAEADRVRRQSRRQHRLVSVHEDMGPSVPPLDAFLYLPSVLPYWQPEDGADAARKPLDNFKDDKKAVMTDAGNHLSGIKQKLFDAVLAAREEAVILVPEMALALPPRSSYAWFSTYDMDRVLADPNSVFDCWQFSSSSSPFLNRLRSCRIPILDGLQYPHILVHQHTCVPLWSSPVKDLTKSEVVANGLETWAQLGRAFHLDDTRMVLRWWMRSLAETVPGNKHSKDVLFRCRVCPGYDRFSALEMFHHYLNDHPPPTDGSRWRTLMYLDLDKSEREQVRAVEVK